MFFLTHLVHPDLVHRTMKYDLHTHNDPQVSFNPYAAGGKFGQYKMMQKPEKWLKPWHMGTHLRALNKNYPMNTNMIGPRWFSKIFASLCFGRK